MASRRSSTAPQPDLFSASPAGGRNKVPPAVPATPRTILSADLPSALANLRDDELEKLADTLAMEMYRRGLARAPLPTGPDQKPKRRSPAAGQHSEPATSASLAQGKLNAIRAAVKAGVKPAVIARQFGVSLAAIRKALDP